MIPDNSLDYAFTRVQHTPMRLLIIEDDRDAAEYLVKAFREVGHVADWSADGEDGLAMGSDGAYDVLVVDRMLPKRDGLSVIGTTGSFTSPVRRPVRVFVALTTALPDTFFCPPVQVVFATVPGAKVSAQLCA